MGVRPGCRPALSQMRISKHTRSCSKTPGAQSLFTRHAGRMMIALPLKNHRENSAKEPGAGVRTRGSYSGLVTHKATQPGP